MIVGIVRRVSIDWIAEFEQRHATSSEGNALNARRNSPPKDSPVNVSERENFAFDHDDGTDRGEFFHPTCFVCSQCRTSLANHSFYHHEKSYLCEKCHIDKAQLCAECQKKILSGEASEFFLSDRSSCPSVAFENKQYHRSCFTCDKCREQIGTSIFFKNKDGKYLCEHCSNEKKDN